MNCKQITLVLTILLSLFSGCKVQTEYVYVKEKEYIRDTTIKYQVDKEYVRDYTGLLDTLHLETGMAEATAWVDTSRAVLAGEIKNKEQEIDIPVQVKEKIVYRDSLVYKEVPVEVVVEKTVHPKYESWLWAWFISSLLCLIAFVVWKIAK